MLKGGYHANGLGRLSTKLDFVVWVKLQNMQLAYLESLCGFLENILLSGLFFPKTTSALGLVHLI